MPAAADAAQYGPVAIVAQRLSSAGTLSAQVGGGIPCQDKVDEKQHSPWQLTRVAIIECCLMSTEDERIGCTRKDNSQREIPSRSTGIVFAVGFLGD